MPVMAMGVAELKRELRERGGFSDTPEIHSFLDGFYMSRIGIRILIGQHIALHEPPRKHQSGELWSTHALRQHPVRHTLQNTAGLL